MRVMIIDGEGQWEYNEEEDDWDWVGDIPQSRSKSGWKWSQRAENIKSKLEAAGVAYDTYTLDEAGNLWSFNETTPFFDCASPDILTMMGGGPWAKAQGEQPKQCVLIYYSYSNLGEPTSSLFICIDFEYGFVNSKWSGVRNVPKKSYRYMQHCMVQIGKMFLNDAVWAT